MSEQTEKKMKSSGLYRLVNSTTEKEMRSRLSEASQLKKLVDEFPTAKRFVQTQKSVFTGTMNPHFGMPSRATEEASSTPIKGTIVDQYRVLCDISKPSDGTLWLCRESEVEGPLMVMRIFDTEGQTDSERWRFDGESQILARLSHPACVRHRHSGRLNDHLSFRVTDFGLGLPITDFCDAESLSIAQRVSAIIDLCSIIEDLHRQGAAGLGMSPGNVLARKDGDSISLQLVDLRVSVAAVNQTQSSRMAVQDDIRFVGRILLQQLTGLTWAQCNDDTTYASKLGVSKILEKQSFAVPRVARYRQLSPEQVANAISDQLNEAVVRAIQCENSDGFESLSELKSALR